MSTGVLQADGTRCYAGPACRRHGHAHGATSQTSSATLITDPLVAQVSELATVISEYWAEHVSDSELGRILAQKEPGHSMSSYVDERTVEALAAAGYRLHHEVHPKTGQKRTRSFGDAWFKVGEEYVPVNIKAGIYSADGGQPNMVSIDRLKNHLLSGSISAYYLAIVKVSEDASGTPVPKTYFVNLLNHLDCTIANFGTGQIMLQEKKFFALMDKPGYAPRALTRAEQIKNLQALWERALKEEERKVAERRLKLEDFTTALDGSGEFAKPALAFGPQLGG